MSSYISYFTPQSWTRAQKNKAELEKTNPTNPVLNEEDEQFLERITTQEGPAPPLPARPQPELSGGKDEGKGVVIGEDGSAEVKGADEVKEVESLEKEKNADDDGEDETGEDSDKKVDLEQEDVVDGLAVGGSQPSAEEVADMRSEEDKPDDKTEEVVESTSIAPLEQTDDKTADSKSEDKMTKSWASYIPSIPSLPTLTKKKDAATTTADTDKKDQDKEEGTSPSPAAPESPKSTKSKKDPFPTQEEAEASTSEGIKKSETLAAETPTGRQTENVSNPRAWSSYVPSLSRGTPQERTAASLASVVKKGKAAEEPPKNAGGSQTDDEKEVGVLLDRLNLSAINNRVFSFSKESQKIYESFTVVLKDIVNGGPTAYEDLEKLIKENEGHLDQMFGNMPPFVKTLVKSLPTKVMGSLGPEVLAAMSEKPGADMQAKMNAESSSTASASASGFNIDTKKKQKRKIPSAKALVTEQGAVASMLKSILNFLKLRFPAFVTGTNVLMSVAVFILLFVFWYCHKRGKEVRLLAQAEKESAEVSEAEDSSDTDESTELEKSIPEVDEDSWIKERKTASGEGVEDVEEEKEAAKEDEADSRAPDLKEEDTGDAKEVAKQDEAELHEPEIETKDAAETK